MRLRIATYNLESFGGDDAKIPLEERILALAPKLTALDADVLCLQEVNAERPRKRAPREPGALDALLAATPYATYERVLTRRDGGGPYDVHNLAIVSRFPIDASKEHLHDAVRPIESELVRGMAPAERLAIGWDRPALEADVALPNGQVLRVIDVHLRAPLASAIEGQKLGPTSWRSTAGWAEGFFVAALKRAGQALEVRLRVDRILDHDPDALVIVAGDFNADPFESPSRILAADVSDTGNTALEARALSRLLDAEEEGRRYSTRYRGRTSLPDQILASRRVARGLRSVTILNADVEDGWDAGLRDQPIAGSLHAPVVVELEIA